MTLTMPIIFKHIGPDGELPEPPNPYSTDEDGWPEPPALKNMIGAMNPDKIIDGGLIVLQRAENGGWSVSFTAGSNSPHIAPSHMGFFTTTAEMILTLWATLETKYDGAQTGAQDGEKYLEPAQEPYDPNKPLELDWDALKKAAKKIPGPGESILGGAKNSDQDWKVQIDGNGKF